MKKYPLFLSLFLGCALYTLPALSAPPVLSLPVSERPAGQENVLALRAPALPSVRVGFIGVGNRGSSAVRRFTYLPDTQIKAICDVNPKAARAAVRQVVLSGRPKPDSYTGAEDWKRVCEREDIDLIYVCTHWALHTPIAVYAMEQGKHVAVEVPIATSVDDCWKIVNTAERTRKHCMMLENCNYDFFELTTLNMAQQGFFGEIVHAEGAYIHDLRSMMFDDSYWEKWRIKENAVKNGNLYPTHGLGPLAHLLNIHRGDRMQSLVSVSSGQFGLSAYASDLFGPDSPEAKASYARGDMNCTVIKTQKGKTILIQHDTTSPRPYSRLHLISGTKAFAQKYPVETLSEGHNIYSPWKLRATLKKYEHPILKTIGQKSKQIGGHGGMDYTMDYRLIFCLKNGLPLDMDVYDGAEWSSIVELSQISVKNNGAPIEIPDFTRGDWQQLSQTTYYYR